MRNTLYVGLDTATVTGIAIFEPNAQIALVLESKGEPHQQVYNIVDALDWAVESMGIDEWAFVMEKQHNFLNAKTARSLLERYGYIKYHLLSKGCRVEEVSPKVARSFLGVKSKEETFRLFTENFEEGSHLTSNHTDALAVALKQANIDGWEIRLSELKISNIQGVLI